MFNISITSPVVIGGQGLFFGTRPHVKLILLTILLRRLNDSSCSFFFALARSLSLIIARYVSRVRASNCAIEPTEINPLSCCWSSMT